MKLIGILAGVCLASASFSAQAAGMGSPNGPADNGFMANVNVLVGQKTLHSNDWATGNGGPDIHSQVGGGIMANLGMRSWPVAIAADLFYNSGSSQGDSGSVTMLSVGARKHFMLQSLPIVPYAGAGFSYGSASLSVSVPGAGSLSGSGSGEGLWLDGGAQYMFNKLGVGLELRYGSCPGKLSFSGQNVNFDLDGFLASLSVGYTF